MKKHKNRFKQYEEISDEFSSEWRKLDLLVPSNLKMLCRLLDLKLETLLKDFMWRLSYMVASGTDEQCQAARDYFLSCGYGKNFYSEKQLQQIFRELDAKKQFWPDVDDEVITPVQEELHYLWSHMHMEYWLEKWKGRKGKFEL
ncbi:hypothetical protein [Desertivirga xinjiangensis]|uniref:hypothetical protein n=1 Tax=Desertivirga xinjiangensis TaxID=539206 RepID=UPI00210EE685|nr:hypothetical protein [Pedobacter xinjiangensis]